MRLSLELVKNFGTMASRHYIIETGPSRELNTQFIIFFKSQNLLTCGISMVVQYGAYVKSINVKALYSPLYDLKLAVKLTLYQRDCSFYYKHTKIIWGNFFQFSLNFIYIHSYTHTYILE